MKKSLVLVLLSLIIVSFGFECNQKDNDEPDPNNEDNLLPYHLKGTLNLLFTNTFPAFAESTALQVSVDKDGHMVFDIGELQYSGEDDNGQSRIRREGELILAPNGEGFKDNGKIYFAVDENTTVEETFTVWVWDGTNWLQTVQETVTYTWNDGLTFSREDAEIGGSVVEATNANGTVRWTLTLVPGLI